MVICNVDVWVLCFHLCKPCTCQRVNACDYALNLCSGYVVTVFVKSAHCVKICVELFDICLFRRIRCAICCCREANNTNTTTLFNIVKNIHNRDNGTTILNAECFDVAIVVVRYRECGQLRLILHNKTCDGAWQTDDF